MPGTTAMAWTTGENPNERRRQSPIHAPSPSLSMRSRLPTRPTRPAAMTVADRYPPTLPHSPAISEPPPPVVNPKIGPREYGRIACARPVSYTHLRAHETDSY